MTPTRKKVFISYSMCYPDTQVRIEHDTQRIYSCRKLQVRNTGEMSLGDIIDNQSNTRLLQNYTISTLGWVSWYWVETGKREKVAHQVASSRKQVCLSRRCQIGGSG